MRQKRDEQWTRPLSVAGLVHTREQSRGRSRCSRTHPPPTRHFSGEKNMKTALTAAVAAATLASVASADVTYTLTNQTFTGFNFSEAAAAGTLAGSLTGASINIVLNASVAYTYADDLCVYVAGNPLATGGMLQCGGYSNLSAGQRYFWPNGGSDVPGTTSIGTVLFTSAIDMAANPTMSVWIGNGYGAAGTSGTFSGTITLHGVSAVPAPAAVALLGLAGLAGRRRR